jgi:L-alanine-DL-glutamate epimerase-like enolase superfamily enzyme
VTATSIEKKIAMSFEPLDLRTLHPFGISYGTSADSHNFLVKLTYKSVVGYGEASPVSYHGENPETAAALLKAWAETDILGDDPFAIAEICRKMDKSISGHNSVKAGIEMALHDICGKIANLPTYKMLGLSGLKQPITDFTIGIDSLEVIEKKTKEALDAGYKVLKVKQGTQYDRDIIKSVRKVAKDIPIRVDANGAWTPKQAVLMAEFLAENNVQFIEQPLPKAASVDDFKFVRDHSPLPIYADESISRSQDVVRLANAIDGVVVKLAKTGGLLEAIKVIQTARAHGMQIMFGCMLESSLGVTAAVHLSSLVDHLDLDGALLLSNDPFNGAIYDDGILRLTDLPGLGVTYK